MKQLDGISTSFELFGVLNKHRVASGEKPYRNHSDLVVKIIKEVGNLDAHENVFIGRINNLGKEVQDKGYKLSRKDVYVVAMRESKEVRSSVYDYLEKIEEENRVLQGIVWQVINGKNYLPQELGAQSAGIERPRLFMKYLKGREHVLKAFMDKNYLEHKRVGKTQQDMAWRWTQKGFQYLLRNRDTLNQRVVELHQQERSGVISF